MGGSLPVSIFCIVGMLKTQLMGSLRRYPIPQLVRCGRVCDAQNPLEVPGVTVYVYNPSAWQPDTGGFLGLAGKPT